MREDPWNGVGQVSRESQQPKEKDRKHSRQKEETLHESHEEVEGTDTSRPCMRGSFSDTT